jgi:formylglycine-generating enzyme required for sulfatase activity
MLLQATSIPFFVNAVYAKHAQVKHLSPPHKVVDNQRVMTSLSLTSSPKGRAGRGKHSVCLFMKKIFMWCAVILIAATVATAQSKKANHKASNKTHSSKASSKKANSRKVGRHPSEPEMVYVQGGMFTMGCTAEQDKDCYDTEEPTHSVRISSFKIGKYEVTQAQWKALMGSNPSINNGDNSPVETVNWNEVQMFIRKLNSATGKNYRLPTEAEWEYAARGGNKSRDYKYSGSDKLNEVAWYEANSGYKSHLVGTKSPNELGIYDMSGNVWEWCSDRFGNYSRRTQTDPTGATKSSYRVNRGGSWNNNAQYCRVADRSYDVPGSSYDYLGLRLVLP